MAQTLKILDPVQGLIDYTNDIKPYHSKVIEALIEYVGTESIEVTVLEEFDFEIGLLYEFNGNYVCLIGGYGTPSFGDPENILVLSPDVSQTIIEYPALGPGFFIVLGDKTVLFDPDVDVVLSISSAIEDKLILVDASSGSPLIGGSFTVLGDKQSDFPVTTEFSIVGSAFNDGDYTVASTTLIASPAAATQINVDQIIPTNNVEGFVSRIDTTNTGTFSVVNSTYNARHLIPHTTVFVTGIALLAPTFTSTTYPNRRFVSSINTQPLTYSGVLSYSSALRQLAGSPVTSSYLADEGVVFASIVAVSAASVSILGDFQTSNLFVGDELIIIDSSGNNGTYAITSLTYEFSGSPVSDFVTTFGVAALPDTTADGTLKLNIPSNVFMVDGSDYTRFFEQGSRVNITSGSHIGVYTTLNSQFFNDKTYIRVRETLIPEGTGLRILSTGTNYITVDGNVEAIYGGSPAGQQFNIVTSQKNDGLYTADSASFDGFTTQIVMDEESLKSFDVTDNTGEIHEFTAGDITHLPEGFGATVDLCELVPQALAISSITEDFDVLLGYKFIIDGTDSATNKLYIQDPDGYAYGIFDAGINTPEGSPIGSPPISFTPDTSIEIISSGINNGTYNITAIETVEGENTILTLAGSPVLSDSGTFSGSPEINGGILLYKKWWQYYVTDITGNDFLVAGNATVDINTTDKNILQHIFTNDIYTVTNVVIEGVNTRITVLPAITTVAGTPSRDITAGSPIYDDWIISPGVSVSYNWAQIAGVLSISPAGTTPAIASLNGTDIAFMDKGSGELRTYRFNGSTWAQVGTGLSISTVGENAITALNGTDVAFINSFPDQLTTYRFNGSTWSQVGSSLFVSGNVPALATLNGTDVALIDSTNKLLRTYRFNGSTWSLVGSGLSIATVGFPALAGLDSTDVVFADSTTDLIQTYRFNGSTWSAIGSSLSIALSVPRVAALNSTDIALTGADDDTLRTYRFNGSTWSLVGNGLAIPIVGVTSIAAFNATDIAYIDDTNDELRNYRFSLS